MNNVPHIELLSPADGRSMQFLKLRELLAYIKHASPFYKRLFAKHRISENDLRSLKDLAKLPTTSKDDLQQHNQDFLCVPATRIIEYTTTSGTLGAPVTIALTEKDLQRLAYNESISFACADGSEQDIYQLMLTLDRQFMAGIAYYEGIRKLGAGLIRVGPGQPSLQWETIERLKPSALVAVPSFLVKLVEYAQAQGIEMSKSSVKKAICIGENIRTPEFELNTIGKKITQAWPIRLYSTYASTEMQTAFTECSAGRGGHHHPELIILELLDENGNLAAPGQPGEVTITTLGVEGMPLLRYKTGDIAHIHDDKCTCGRNTVRVGPVLGRKQQMIKLKGTTLYPPGIFDMLNQFVLVKDYVVEAFTGDLGTDELRLHVSVQDELQPQAQHALQSIFQSRLRVVPEFNFISAKEIEGLQMDGGGRKVKRFIDNRSSKPQD